MEFEGYMPIATNTRFEGYMPTNIEFGFITASNNFSFEGLETCTAKNRFEGYEPRQTTCIDSISGNISSSGSLHPQTQQQLINHVSKPSKLPTQTETQKQKWNRSLE